jgi:chromosome segregation protein
MLFDESNLKNVVYKLNGEAEVFYRKSSIKESNAIIHKANESILNKNELNTKKTSIFKYDIIKDRNNTINTLLEEAAGISKYKIRKKQTFQKLEETDADLNRVNDLLFEIEKSLKQLETQAKKTDRYYRLKEEYKDISTQLAVYSIQNNSSSFEDLKNKEQSLGEVKAEMQQKLKEYELHLATIKGQTSEKEIALQAAQKSYNEKLLEITRFENDEKNKNEKFNFLIEKQKQLQTSSFNASIVRGWRRGLLTSLH